MVGEPSGARTSPDETILQQQYLQALSSFEGIVLSQIDVKNRLGDRLNYSIRAGLIILSVIAFSILVLLLTLSSQINRISNVVGAMNRTSQPCPCAWIEIATPPGLMEAQVADLTIENATRSTCRTNSAHPATAPVRWKSACSASASR